MAWSYSVGDGAPVVSGLPIRKASVARRPQRQSEGGTQRRQGNVVVWDLDGIQAVQDAVQRVRSSRTWQRTVSVAKELNLSGHEAELAALRAERDGNETLRRLAEERRVTRTIDEHRRMTEARDAARREVVAAETTRLDQQAEQERVAVEERRRIEAETQRLAAEQGAEQVPADEERRRGRLRECVACLEEHDLAEVVQLACSHWYCRDALRRMHLPSIHRALGGGYRG
jgi:hypothetical protein